MPIENDNRTLAQKLSINTFAQFAGKGISSLFSIATTFLLTHYALVGHDGFGIYIFALTFTAIFGTFADWGVSTVVIGEASKNEKRSGEIVGNAVILRLFLSVAAATLAIIAVNFFTGSDELTKLVTSLAAINLILLTLKTSFQSVFNIKLKMHNWAISEGFNNLLILVMVLLMILYKRGLTEIVIGIILANFTAVILTYLLSRRLLKIKFHFDVSIAKKIFLTALPMGTVMGVLILYNRLDMILLSFFKGPHAVADYGLAYRIFDVIFIFGSYFVATTLPIITSLAGKDKNKLKIFWSQCTSIILLMGSAICLATIFLAPFFISLIGGEAFSAATFPLQLLSFSFIISFLNVMNGYLFLTLGKPWVWFKIAVFALFFNLIVNIITLPVFSLNAAALNTGLTETIILLLSWLALKKEVGSPFQKTNPLSMLNEYLSNPKKLLSQFGIKI